MAQDRASRYTCQMAATIDTLETLRELQGAGVPERQAEAGARLVKQRYDTDREEMVTREYLDLALAKLSAELRGEAAKLERDLVLKLGAIITLAIAIVGCLGVLF